jgi:RNA recognition motif-containing protein
MSTKLFVGKLSYGTTDQQLSDHFSQAGTVTSAKVITDRYSGQGKGFGFVEMATEEEAKKAMDQLNNSDLDGRSIVVNEAKPREDHGDRGSSNRY